MKTIQGEQGMKTDKGEQEMKTYETPELIVVILGSEDLLIDSSDEFGREKINTTITEFDSIVFPF